MKPNKITKDLIISTTISIADKKGIHNVTLKDVASTLDIKTPSLYNHVNGLQDLYNLLSYHGLSMLQEQLIKATVALSGKEALYSIAHAYRNFAIQNPSLYESTQWVSSWKDTENKKLADNIVDVLAKVLLPYQFSYENNISIIRMFRSYLHGFVTLEIHDSFGLDVDINESFELGLSTVIQSIIPAT